MDAIDFEGEEYSQPDFTEAMFDDGKERDARVREAFFHLTEGQQKRFIMLAKGHSIQEIARREGKNFKSGYKSIEAARKNF